MTNLEKEILITKDQNNEKLTQEEVLKLKMYPNKENSLLIHVMKAKHGVPTQL